MCRSVHVKLSHSEVEQVKKLSGVLIPVYASVAALLIAAAVLTSAPRPAEPIAVAANSTAR